VPAANEGVLTPGERVSPNGPKPALGAPETIYGGALTPPTASQMTDVTPNQWGNPRPLKSGEEIRR
jgi:hypothetical protein